MDKRDFRWPQHTPNTPLHHLKQHYWRWSAFSGKHEQLCCPCVILGLQQRTFSIDYCFNKRLSNIKLTIQEFQKTKRICFLILSKNQNDELLLITNPLKFLIHFLLIIKSTTFPQHHLLLTKWGTLLNTVIKLFTYSHIQIISVEFGVRWQMLLDLWCSCKTYTDTWGF